MTVIVAETNSILDIHDNHVSNKFISQNILDKCPLTKLHIESFLKEYSNNLNIEPLIISDSWITEYSKQDYIVPHNHLPKFVSGVVFVKQSQTGGYFYFENPLEDVDNITQHNKYLNNINLHQRVHMFQPTEGQIIIFKSLMRHGTTPVLSDDTRYSLAFNAKF